MNNSGAQRNHAFILRIWSEEVAEAENEAAWTGTITHVPDGAYRYVREVDDIVAFLGPYLAEVSPAEPSWRRRLLRWLRNVATKKATR